MSIKSGLAFRGVFVGALTVIALGIVASFLCFAKTIESNKMRPKLNDFEYIAAMCFGPKQPTENRM